jgi:alpha-amylase
MKIFAITLLFALAITSFTKTAEEWKSRTIYQILTDRFAKDDGDTTPCKDISTYCGGTYQGIINNLDYIQGMGFDAIWISPVIENNPGGYHGYWAKNIYEMNEYFGGASGLRALIDACHARDIWVMVDVVGNHMGNMMPGAAVDDFSDKYPFNDPAHYHSNIDCSAFIGTYKQDSLDTCWLAQLPDLDQDNDFVRSTLLQWINDLVTTYDLDGLRIDTVAYVPKDFWYDFSKAAGVYAVGEVFDSSFEYVSGYQGPIDGILNYPFFYALRDSFQQNKSMKGIHAYYKNASVYWPDVTTLGSFIDNHDNARFLHGNNNQVLFKSALAFSLTAVGIPIVYYGNEQAFAGGDDPKNREPLWTDMDPNSDIYGFLSTVINFRKAAKIYQYDQVESHVDDSFYSFYRGEHYFAFTNSQEKLNRIIKAHPYSEGTVLYNIFRPTETVKVIKGLFRVHLNEGEVKIYTPVNDMITN